MESLIRKPPAYVILGQSNYSKAVVANEILEKAVLPTRAPLGGPPDSGVAQGPEIKWRTVQLKYGDTPRVSLCLANSFELVNTVEAQIQPGHTISVEDLLLRSNSTEAPQPAENNESSDVCMQCSKPRKPSTGSDCVDSPPRSPVHFQNKQPEGTVDIGLHSQDFCDCCTTASRNSRDVEGAMLEVRINHVLLREGTQIIVTQTLDSRGRVSLKKVVDSCCHEVVPIFIYSLACDRLSDQVRFF